MKEVAQGSHITIMETPLLNYFRTLDVLTVCEGHRKLFRRRRGLAPLTPFESVGPGDASAPAFSMMCPVPPHGS
jgi:hypothetical protein